MYRARDTKLNRDVALKVLLPEVLDSLNHPHIGAIQASKNATLRQAQGRRPRSRSSSNSWTVPTSPIESRVGAASTSFCWTLDYTTRLPSANPLPAASALSSGRVLKAIAAPGATL